jgi:hypothetical protein
MSFLDRLLGRIKPKPEKRYYIYQVSCKRCGEVIEGRVDVDNDLSVEYESGGDVFYARKVLMGDGSRHCYQQIEVGLKFDKDRRLLERRVASGGEFVE